MTTTDKPKDTFKTVFFIEVDMSKDLDGASVTIAARPTPPEFAALMVATEHLMTLTCLQADSGCEFEERLRLLCEGARKNKILELQGVPQRPA